MTEDDFTRALQRELARELDCVPLTASHPAQARYRAPQNSRGAVRSGWAARRSAGALGALVLALVTSVVVASAAPGAPAWAAEAEKLVTAFVGAAPTHPAGAPLPAAAAPQSAESDHRPAASEPVHSPDGERPGPRGRDGNQRRVQEPVQERNTEEQKTPEPIEKRDTATAEEFSEEPTVVAPGKPEEVEHEQHRGGEKEKTSDFSSDRSSSVRP